MACNQYDFYVNGVFQDPYVLKSDIVDNLTSTDTDKPLSANQGKVVNDKIVVLEDMLYEYEIFENIGSGTTGTVTLPTGGTVRLDQYQGLADCLIAETENGRPIDQPVTDSSKVIITATFDSSGNYVLSGTPSSYPISLIYQVAIKGVDIGGIPLDSIVDWTEIHPPLQNVINVAKSGGDFTSLNDALVSITDSSSTNRYVVRVAPGIYTEDNPMMCKEYVIVKSIGDLQTTRIVAGNASADLFTMCNFFLLEGLTLWGVTGATNYAVNQEVAGLTSLSRCAIAECTNGIHVNHVDANISLTDTGMYNLTATTTRGIYVEAGTLSSSVLTGALGNITTLIEITGTNSIARINHVSSEISTLGTAIFCRDLAKVGIGEIDLANMVDGIVCEGGSEVRITASYINNAQNDGLRINNVGANTKLDMQAITIEDSVGFDVNLLSETALLVGTGKTSIDNVNFVTNVGVYAAIIDTKLDDEGYNVLGELHVGIAERGSESVFGEGDSYTRGMLVYTETAGGTFVDISTEARSSSASTFTFPGITANNSIYIASNLSNNDGVLEHYGIKTNVLTVADLGVSGEIIIEYWNGTSWVEEDGMEVASSGSYFPYANNYFQHLGSHQIRYNSELETDTWTKNDPITPSLGTSYNWVRFRIVSDITTAPIFEQFKLHTNRYEINSDGWVEYFGKARPIGTLPWKISDANGWGSSPSNTDLFILDSGDGDDFDIGIGGNENGLSAGARDRIGIAVPIPLDMDTSSPIKIEVYWMGTSATAGDILWRTSGGTLRVGDGIGTSIGDAPATIRDGAIVSTLEAVGSNEEGILKVSKFTLNLPSAISRDSTTGNADFVCLSIASDGGAATDTYAGSRNILNVRATYTKWCEGGHI